MMPLSRYVRRWRRSRGFGVHSPFAYRFITMVLRGRMVYYSSAEIESMPDAGWHRLLFRFVCEFEPAEVCAPAFSPTERRAIALADSRVRLLADGGVGELTMCSPKGDVAIVRDITLAPVRWRALRDGMTAGMTFTNGRTGIAVSRPDLPRQDFEILF